MRKTGARTKSCPLSLVLQFCLPRDDEIAYELQVCVALSFTERAAWLVSPVNLKVTD